MTSHMKRLITVFIAVLGFGLQGCFDIIEQITVHDNGSGSFQLVLNLSRSKVKINSLMKMKTVNGHPVPSKEELKADAAEFENKLSAVQGLSAVKTTIDFNNFIGTLNFNFSNVDKLNAALRKIGEQAKDQKQGFSEAYRYDANNRTFSRINKFAFAEGYRKMSVADREIFASATYTNIFRFDSDIQSVNNPVSKIAANKKAVMTKASALDIIKGKKNIDNQINLLK